jgi:hypothetical protein
VREQVNYKEMVAASEEFLDLTAQVKSNSISAMDKTRYNQLVDWLSQLTMQGIFTELGKHGQ